MIKRNIGLNLQDSCKIGPDTEETEVKDPDLCVEKGKDVICGRLLNSEVPSQSPSNCVPRSVGKRHTVNNSNREYRGAQYSHLKVISSRGRVQKIYSVPAERRLVLGKTKTPFAEGWQLADSSRQEENTSINMFSLSTFHHNPKAAEI
jgi:hypothetical protein